MNIPRPTEDHRRKLARLGALALVHLERFASSAHTDPNGVMSRDLDDDRALILEALLREAQKLRLVWPESMAGAEKGKD